MLQTLKLPALDALSERWERCAIGVFDSGVGGLSILRALRARMPEASLVYFGDVAHAPYGDRSADEVIGRCLQVVQWLVAQGAKMIVVACNTATVLAIDQLRARWPNLLFVGVEPGVRPAAASSRTRRIAVLTTVATAHSDRMRHLIERYADGVHVHVQPCPGLADAIEHGVLSGPNLLDVLNPHCDAIRAANVDTVVLGCTHYPFVEPSLRVLLGPGVTIIDTTTAVADRCASLWLKATQLRAAVFDPLPSLRVVSTGATGTMQRLLEDCPNLERIVVEVLTIIPANPPG